MSSLSQYWLGFSRSLFPRLSESLEAPLTPDLERFIRCLEILQVERLLPASRSSGGRIPHERRALARAFLAKAHFNWGTTRMLRDRLLVDRVLRQLCGWETRHQVPSEATFSRAFAAFADHELLAHAHELLVREFAGEVLFWHVAHDATAIEARERVTTAPAPLPPKAAADGPTQLPFTPSELEPPAPIPSPPAPVYGQSRGRKKRPKHPTRLEQQYRDQERSFAEQVALLPQDCGWGWKTDSRGRRHYWRGYKLHLAVGDRGFPLLAVTTSASLHDSQCVIPMLRETSRRARSLYDLMDSAYEGEWIEKTSLDLDHQPLVIQSRRRPNQPETEPDRQRRLQHRTLIERCYARLKDNHGGRTVRVRGAKKVHTHLMFGLLIIAALVLQTWD